MNPLRTCAATAHVCRGLVRTPEPGKIMRLRQLPNKRHALQVTITRDNQYGNGGFEAGGNDVRVYRYSGAEQPAQLYCVAAHVDVATQE